MPLALLTLLVAGLWLLLGWLRSGQPPLIYFLRTFVSLYARLWHGCRIRSYAPIPPAGAALIVVNHTCSADAMFVQAACLRPITFLFAREFFDGLPPFRWVFRSTACVPVRRDNRDIGAAREGLRRLAEGRVVCIFPEGDLSGAERGRMRPGKCGAAWLALRSTALVIPAHIAGGPQTSDIATAWLRPSFGTRIRFGPPLDLSRWRGRRVTRPLLEEVHRHLMRQVAAIALDRSKESAS